MHTSRERIRALFLRRNQGGLGGHLNEDAEVVLIGVSVVSGRHLLQSHLFVDEL